MTLTDTMNAQCAICGGIGEVYGHAEDCTDDLCALNGDIHSCAGKVEICECVERPTRKLPAMHGVGRDAENPQTLVVYLKAPASNDELRAVHAALRAEAVPVAISTPAKLPFGIIDPDYATAYTKARIAAWQFGYAIALHGSFTRDLDLIAIPWTDHACDLETLVRGIEYRTGLKRQGPPSDKPHGRKAVSLLFPGFEDPRWVDLSILPRVPAISAEPLVRYCPGCGSVGPVDSKYRDCCPDGNEARMIPQALAEKCRDTFKIAVGVLTTAEKPAAIAFRDMSTAPRDGSLLRLLVEFEDAPLDDDNSVPQVTIGMNNLGNTGDDEWQFAGWDWSHDCFAQGTGKPVGWLPLLSDAEAAAAPNAKVRYEVTSVRYLEGEVALRALNDAEVPQTVEAGQVVELQEVQP
ncbi:hypothetical protein [Ottowia sp. VDI28]|uniref:hypothetical protein n=1 Tax=Ottowia sp. VDI28 TaxID=3133968 RepID=UPI003C2E4C2B